MLKCENCCYYSFSEDVNYEHCCFSDWGHSDFETAPCDETSYDEPEYEYSEIDDSIFWGSEENADAFGGGKY